MNIRFTEGPHYTETLAQLFPGRPLLEVGYANCFVADIGMHASNPDMLKNSVGKQLQQPEQFRAKRRKYTARLIGSTDGHVSRRIVDYLVANRNHPS